MSKYGQEHPNYFKYLLTAIIALIIYIKWKKKQRQKLLLIKQKEAEKRHKNKIKLIDAEIKKLEKAILNESKQNEKNEIIEMKRKIYVIGKFNMGNGVVLVDYVNFKGQKKTFRDTTGFFADKLEKTYQKLPKCVI